MNSFKHHKVYSLLSMILIAFTLVTKIQGKALAYSTPILGMNFDFINAQGQTNGCDLTGADLIKNYNMPGVRPHVQDYLKQMHDNGVSSIRFLIWHETTITGPTNAIPSVGGVIGEPYRTNLIQYLSDIRTAGYSSFNVSFSPRGAGNPTEKDGITYDPAQFDENWHFIQDVRGLAKQYGPATLRVDLDNEAAHMTGWVTRE